MKNLIALVALSLSAFGAESTKEPVKAELEESNFVAVDKATEAKSTATPAEITQRLESNGSGWLLNEADREKLPITVTNCRNEACTGPTAHKATPYGLLVRHGDRSIWCGWEQLPAQTRQKYQMIVAEAILADDEWSSADDLVIATEPIVAAEAQSILPDDAEAIIAEAQRRNYRAIVVITPPAVAATNPAYTSPAPTTAYGRTYRSSSSASSSGKTVPVRGYTRKDGTYVQPHTRRPPRR